MTKNITSLGARENEFLVTLSGTDKNIFTLREAGEFWGSPHNAKIAIHRLITKGWLALIEKGKYLIIPFEAGPSRKWTEDAAIIASALVQPAAIAYWSAIRHWNWTEQIPRIVYVQTTKRKSSPRRKIFGVQYEIVTVASKKFFGMAKAWRNGKPFFVTDREKTLVDCADDVDRAGSIEEGALNPLTSNAFVSSQFAAVRILGETNVIIDGCDSGVPNTVTPGGLTISELVADCAEEATNHGQFVSCIAQVTNDLRKNGIITAQQKRALQTCGAQADNP